MKKAAFTLIVVVGVLAMIALPNLHRAIQRGKGKRTMSDLRTLGTSVESYQVDTGHYPIAENLDDLTAILSPTYVKRPPRLDPWGTEYEYRYWRVRDGVLVPGAPDSCGLRSAGSDGLWQYADYTDYTLGTLSAEPGDDDILFGGVVYERPLRQRPS